MSSDDIIIQPALPDDIGMVAELSRDLIEDGLNWTWNAPRIVRTLRHEESTLICALDGDVIAGFALMVFGRETAHLNLLAVRPEYRGIGIGRLLHDWLEHSVVTAGIGRIILEVRARNNVARTFYKQLGYQENAILEGYYQSVETAVRMIKELPDLDTDTRKQAQNAIDDLLGGLKGQNQLPK